MKILRFFGLLLLLAACAVGYLYYRQEIPYRGFLRDPSTWICSRGTSAPDGIATLLANAGVVRVAASTFCFRAWYIPWC